MRKHLDIDLIIKAGEDSTDYSTHRNRYTPPECDLDHDIITFVRPALTGTNIKVSLAELGLFSDNQYSYEMMIIHNTGTAEYSNIRYNDGVTTEWTDTASIGAGKISVRPAPQGTYAYSDPFLTFVPGGAMTSGNLILYFIKGA